MTGLQAAIYSIKMLLEPEAGAAAGAAAAAVGLQMARLFLLWVVDCEKDAYPYMLKIVDSVTPIGAVELLVAFELAAGPHV